MFVDSHAHIDGEQFDVDRDEVVERARAAGVRAILNVGTGDPQSGELERAVAVAEAYENVFASVGVHPHDARLYTEAAESRLLKILRSGGRVIALGEIGLDFYYDNSPREIQREAFARQLRLAREESLPVIIHSREADEETVEILRAEFEGAGRGGIMHCFGGGLKMAEDVLALGFMISFAGNVTFKKAENLREVARIVETARFLAELLDIEHEELGRITTQNFARFFQLKLD
jgi:TatD DNase family protein